MSDDTLVIILAGGVGERLFPLTKERAKPAVFFGGPYRIIDFTLSNCINSGYRRIFICTQYKSLSLNRHVRMGWSVTPTLSPTLTVLAFQPERSRMFGPPASMAQLSVPPDAAATSTNSQT